jgi:hypothetical protein
MSSTVATRIVITASSLEICLQHAGGDTIAERYENIVSPLERITQAGYQFKVQWECEFETPDDMEVVEILPLRNRYALYGGRTETMRLHCRLKEYTETIQHVDIMSLYPWVRKYIKFRVGHPTIHLDCGDI